MIDHAPTEKINAKQFGIGDDHSVPASGIYYRTINNLPWVLEVPVSFNYTTAKSDIVKGYLKYGEWAQSNGTKSKDWYMNKTGYRNNAYIYTKK